MILLKQNFGSLHDKFKTHKYYEYFLDFFFCTLGAILYGVSVTIFTAPNNIAPGGITGISTMLHYLFNAPIGTMIFILNIPLFILGLRFIGGSFIIKTITCTALTSVVIDVFTAVNLPVYHGDKLLAAVYGGVLAGTGLALVFLRGATTGGTDIASRLVKIKLKHISMGRMMLIIDFFVIVVAALVFRSVDSALYAMIAIFTASRVIDSILYGSDNGKMAVVISKNNDEIAKAIINDMNRGLTILKGKGFYTGKEREVIMCAVRRPEAARLRTIIKKVDPNAFIIMCDAGEIIGEGFKPINKEI
jgi:uncharacterized membrane-anchored protein YitT (DUF2179 family)